MKRTERKPWLAAALVAVLVVAGASGWYWTHRTPSRQIASESKSLAVLPLANLSEDKDMTFFADGIHEDLLTQLALLGDLKVVSRTSVLEYRDTRKNSRQIAAELGVGALLEGSVRRAGNQVRVTAQLIDGSTDKHVWAKSYDRELKDIFAIQSERPTENLEAYDLFLKHQDLANQAASGVRAATGVKERIVALQKAVDLDPNFALAWARLAAEHARAYGYGVDQTPARRAEAMKAMQRALALAPDDPQIKIEQGVYYLRALDDEGQAEKAYREVLAVAPNNVDALIGLADVLFRNLRWNERIPMLQRAIAIDPRNVPALVRLANGYRSFRQFDKARELRMRLVEIRPGDIELQANVYLVDLADFATVNKVMSEYFREPYPARAAVGVAALPRGAQVEVECIVAL